MAHLGWQTVSSKHLQWRTMTISQHITENTATFCVRFAHITLHIILHVSHTPVAMAITAAVFSVKRVLWQNRQPTVGTVDIFTKCVLCQVHAEAEGTFGNWAHKTTYQTNGTSSLFPRHVSTQSLNYKRLNILTISHELPFNTRKANLYAALA
jgi:hypothetical protein